MRVDIPFIEAERRCPTVPSFVLSDGIIECLARPCDFCFPCGLSIANELEYGVGAVQIDDKEPVGGELVFCEWSMREFYALRYMPMS
jgi:hypothetical protein